MKLQQYLSSVESRGINEPQLRQTAEVSLSPLWDNATLCELHCPAERLPFCSASRHRQPPPNSESLNGAAEPPDSHFPRSNQLAGSNLPLDLLSNALTLTDIEVKCQRCTGPSGVSGAPGSVQTLRDNAGSVCERSLVNGTAAAGGSDGTPQNW